MSLRNSERPADSFKVLLVDDNVQGLKARRAVLEELGYRTTTASSGADALREFAAGTFHLVVTDYKMPKMTGTELISELRKLQPGVAIILLSGFVDALGLNEANTAADAVIQKSANEVGHLTRAVARLTRRKPVKKTAASDPGPPKVMRKTV